MRIGQILTSGVAFQKFDKVQQRVLVHKHIPQAIQVFLYDLNYPNPTTLHIEGTLVGSTASDLATKMQQLRAVCRQRKVIWIDASDAYQGRLDLCKVQKLQGPIVDSNTSGLTSTFIIDAQILPPWGSSHTNPWKQDGIYFRDLNNIGREYALNPLMNHCNFTLDESSGPYSFSWEFIVDNQNPFTNATSVQETSCDSLGSGTASPTNPIAANGVLNSQFDSISIDTTNKAEGSGSLKGSKTTPAANTNYSMGYNFGTSGLNVSSYDRLRIWYRCDQASQNQYVIFIVDMSGNWREWYFTLQAANTWMNLELPLETYSSQSTTAPNLSDIQYVAAIVKTAATAPSSVNQWIDDIRFEVGYVNHCEDTNGWTSFNGSGITYSNDTSIYKEGSASFKVTGTQNGSTQADAVLPTPFAFDCTNYEFLLLWLRSDFCGQSTGDFRINIGTNSSNYWKWTYSNFNANRWYRLVIPLKNPNSTTGSPNIASIAYFQIYPQVTSGSNVGNLWIDEIAFDVGNWVSLESMVPDNVAQWGGIVGSSFPTQTILVQDWTGSAYTNLMWWDVFSSAWNEANISFLDGSSGQNIYGNYWGMATYNVGTVGSPMVKGLGLGVGLAPPSKFTMTYGTNTRMAFGLQLPPATSDSGTGNYPSNDLTGYQAINKVRLKVKVNFTNDDTTYTGF